MFGKKLGNSVDPSITPHGSPQMTPCGTPHRSPQRTPHGSLSRIPRKIKSRTPRGSSSGTPKKTPEGTMHGTTSQCLRSEKKCILVLRQNFGSKQVVSTPTHFSKLINKEWRKKFFFHFLP